MALHLAYSWAKTLFQKSPINPQRDCYNLGQQCQLCHQPIKPAICVVVCKCQKYSHYNCLLEKFASFTRETHKEARCDVCHEVIKITYEMRTVLKPKLEMCLLIESLIALAVLAQCGYLLINSIQMMQNTMNKISNQESLKLAGAAAGVIVSSVWIILLIKKIFWKRELRIAKIHPAPMDMKSKIEDFDIRLQSQFNNVQIIEQPNKHHEESFKNIQIAI